MVTEFPGIRISGSSMSYLRHDVRNFKTYASGYEGAFLARVLRTIGGQAPFPET